MARAERLHLFVRLDVLLHLLERFRRRDVVGAELEIAGPVLQFFTSGPTQERGKNWRRRDRRTKFQKCAFVHRLERRHEWWRVKTISIPFVKFSNEGDCTPCRSKVRVGHRNEQKNPGRMPTPPKACERLRKKDGGLLHASSGIPPAFLAADVEDLAGVVGIVSANVRDARRIFLKRRFVGSFDEFFEVGHHLIELRDGFSPGLCIETIECLFVVVGVCGLLAFDSSQRFLVPKDKMIGELADGMIAGVVFPRGLLGGQSVDGEARRYEPVLLFMIRLKLFEKNTAECHGLFVLFLRERGCAENREDCNEHNRTFHFSPRKDALRWTEGTAEGQQVKRHG